MARIYLLGAVQKSDEAASCVLLTFRYLVVYYLAIVRTANVLSNIGCICSTERLP